MIKKADGNVARVRRHKAIRTKISGTAETPRLNVFKSLNNIYAQVIDDVAQTTLVSASTLDAEVKSKLDAALANLEVSDIEVGAILDDADFIAAANNLVE